MAQIRLDDEVYDRLKSCADSDNRTVGEEIHFLLDNRITLVEIHDFISKKSLAEPKKESEIPQDGGSERKIVRSYRDVKAEMDRIKCEYEKKLSWCQDNETASVIYAEMEDALKPLQEEINLMFGGKDD